jgi:hypothetical protein
MLLCSRISVKITKEVEMAASRAVKISIGVVLVQASWGMNPPSVAACGFARGADNIFFSMEAELYRPRTRFDQNRNVRQAFSEFDQTVIRFFGEAGLNDQVTLNLKTDYFDNTNRFESNGQQVSQSSSGFGDLEIGVRYTWQQDPSFSTQVKGLIPTGYDTSNPLPLGYGEFGYDLSVGLGNSGVLGERPVFYDSCLTFRNYFGDAGSRIKVNISGGVDLSDSIQLITGLDGDFSLGNGNPQFLNGNPILDPDFDNVKLSGQFTFRVAEDVRIMVGGFHFLTGRDVSAGGGFKLGLWLDF